MNWTQIRRFGLVAGLLTSLSFFSTSYAAPPGGPGGPGRDPVGQAVSMFAPKMSLQGFVQQLNLTDAQKVQIRTILQSSQGNMQSLKSQLRKDKSALKQLAMSDNLTDTQINQMTSKMANLYQQMATLKTKNAHKIYAVLTDQQKSLIQQHHNTMNQLSSSNN